MHDYTKPCETDADCRYLTGDRGAICKHGTNAYVEPGQVVFTPDNWDIEQQFELHAYDDDVYEGDPYQKDSGAIRDSRLKFVTESIDPDYQGVQRDAAVFIEDNDVAGVLIGYEDPVTGSAIDVVSRGQDSVADVFVLENALSELSFRLSSEPQDDVKVTVWRQPNEGERSPFKIGPEVTGGGTVDAQGRVVLGVLTFTTTSWNVPMNIPVKTEDLDGKADVFARIHFEIDSRDINYRNVNGGSAKIAASDSECTVTPWGPWTVCSATCATTVSTTGVKKRFRSVKVAPRDGKTCPYALEDEASCEVEACLGSGRRVTIEVVLPIADGTTVADVVRGIKSLLGTDDGVTAARGTSSGEVVVLIKSPAGDLEAFEKTLRSALSQEVAKDDADAQAPLSAVIRDAERTSIKVYGIEDHAYYCEVGSLGANLDTCNSCPDDYDERTVTCCEATGVNNTECAADVDGVSNQYCHALNRPSTDCSSKTLQWIIIGSTSGLTAIVAAFAIFVKYRPEGAKGLVRSVRFGKKRKAAKERDAEALDDNSQKDNAMKETCAALFMAPPPNLDVLVEGINVWVYYPSDDSYYQGTITRRNEDSTFEVSFLDGDEDEAVNPANLRVCPPPVIIHRGMRIRARRKAGEPLESGTVERFVKDGVYKVRFDSGRVESVSRALMEVVHLGPDDRFEYEAELSTHDGLGMSFGKTENNRILVTGFQKLRNGKRGEAEKSGMIHINDEILSINGTSVEGLTLQQVAEIIRAGRQDKP